MQKQKTSETTKILIAEDQDDLREMIAHTLRLSGYEVVSAKNGERAVQLATKINPDLIILDYELPRLNGRQVCKRLKALETFTNTPIVIISSYGNPRYMEASLEAGAEEFIRKPFELDHLIQRVDTLLAAD